MSGFTREAFTGKLSKLSDSQASIQTLSHWVQYHKKACTESAAAWAAETLRVPPARQLIFMYLANDILQNSRRKGPEFVKTYGPQLVTVMPKVYANASASVQGKLQRLLGIWEERQVLPSQTLADIRTRMGTGGAAADASGSVGGSSITIGTKRPREAAAVDEDDEYVPTSVSPSASDRGGGGGGGGGGVSQSQRSVAGSSSGAVGSGGGIGGALGGGAAADAMPLAELLESLEQGSLTDELQAERDADLDMNSLEDLELSDPSEIGEVRAKSDAALQLLASQKARIEAELKSRQQLILLLSRSVEQQNAQCQKLKGALKGCDAMLATARSAAEQVQAMEEQMASIAAAASEAM